MSSNYSHHHQKQFQIDQLVDSWRHLPQEVIARLPKGLRAKMSERQQRSGKSRVAESRIDDLKPTATRQPSDSFKKATKIVVVMIGALTFSAGTQVLTSRLGSMALPAAMAGGALASFLVDDRATKVTTKARLAHSTNQALSSIIKQKESQSFINELGELYYSIQTALIQEIEGKNLGKQLWIDGVLAGSLSAAEFTINFWIVAQLGLPGGLLIEAIAASLPVTLIWIAAAFQSDHFELPEKFADLMNKYEPALFPPVGMTEEELHNLLTMEIAQEQRIDYLVKFVAEGDDSGRLKNLPMAEADYDINQIRDRKYQLEQERDIAVEQRLFAHRAEINNLPNQFPIPEVNLTGLSPQQIKEKEEKIKQQKAIWVQQKTAELKANLEQDLKIIAHRYETQIKQCEEDLTEVQKRYHEGYDRWQEDDEPRSDIA
ncbi:hypothetical protein PCC9214_05560 [Planktothrix tepida]|uniref:Uncharacterized protein n=1 Tax=Planktothrix tepida PCC 9214 TaxID=671072 RepID=A0A1J1LSA5_9CYAN|nr:hypothetical protein [Planktothrix tepida]CAD5989402.1 hypothetical protein PCC9214_05560 [Planktothrix tepida]CUR35483.1 membrane hypothetical protein [Planktothrix tepida PCC 9214]